MKGLYCTRFTVQYRKEGVFSFMSVASLHTVIRIKGRYHNQYSNVRTLSYMNKDQLLDALAMKSGVTKKQAGDVLDAFIDTVTSTLSSGDSVALTGFGTFQVSHRAARAGGKSVV